MDEFFMNGVLKSYEVSVVMLSDNSARDYQLDSFSHEKILHLKLSAAHRISIRAATAVGPGPAVSFLIPEPDKGRLLT